MRVRVHHRRTFALRGFRFCVHVEQVRPRTRARGSFYLHVDYQTKKRRPIKSSKALSSPWRYAANNCRTFTFHNNGSSASEADKNLKQESCLCSARG